MEYPICKLRAYICAAFDQTTSWGSPHRTFDPDPMRIGNLDPKTTLPPNDLNPDPSRMLCCIRQCVKSSLAVQCAPVFVVFGAHTWDHIESGLGIQICWIQLQCPWGESLEKEILHTQYDTLRFILHVVFDVKIIENKDVVDIVWHVIWGYIPCVTFDQMTE